MLKWSTVRNSMEVECRLVRKNNFFRALADCCFANKLRKIFIQSAKKKRRLKGF